MCAFPRCPDCRRLGPARQLQPNLGLRSTIGHPRASLRTLLHSLALMWRRARTCATGLPVPGIHDAGKSCTGKPVPPTILELANREQAVGAHLDCRSPARRPHWLSVAVAAGIFWFAAAPALAQDSPQTASGIRLAPKAFRAAAARVRPSLVTIESFGGVAPGSGTRSVARLGEGPTTGVVVSSDGYIITSTFNLARRPPVITVALQDGSRHVAQLCGRDNTRKLCVLKINAPQPLPVLQVAPQSEIRVGQWAIAVGMGFGGNEAAVSAGIVSALGRIAGRAVQTDAKTSPANYGGPLVDVQGRVIGICVPLHPQSKDVTSGVQWYDSGIGFAIPLDGLDTILAAMKEGKVLEPAFVGIQLKPVDGDEAGVVVAKVQPDSPADTAKIRDGDRILKLDDASVRDAPHLKLLIAQHVAGDTVQLKIQRDEKELTVDVVLAKPPANGDPGPAVRIKKTPGQPPPSRQRYQAF